MLYTRKGDDGTTKTLDSKSRAAKSGGRNADGRISKSSCQTEALGALDELNSFLGLTKAKSKNVKWKVKGKIPAIIINEVQNNLFIIQAEVAGADKVLAKDSIKDLEILTDTIEKILPPIKTFLISGADEISALFDVSRTLARKAERRVIGAHEAHETKVSALTLAYLNRLSSLLYALARLSAHKSGINEQSPTY